MQPPELSEIVLVYTRDKTAPVRLKGPRTTTLGGRHFLSGQVVYAEDPGRSGPRMHIDVESIVSIIELGAETEWRAGCRNRGPNADPSAACDDSHLP